MKRLYVAALVLVACRVGDLVESPGGAGLRFAVQPARADPGVVITPAVQVVVLDLAGRPDTAFHGSVALELAHNPGGAVLLGSTSVVVEQGIAIFSDLRLDQPGRGYVLRASAPARPPAMSAPFEVVDDSTPIPPTPQLAFTVQPSATQTGNPITPAVRVAARDSAGTTITSFTGTITIAIGANPGGGTLSGTTSATASDGVATFDDLSIDRAGNGYTLTVAASGAAGGTSTTFNVTPPPPPQARRLAFTIQPSATVAGNVIAPAVQVVAHDSAGNLVTGFTGTITIALGANPGGATLSGTLTAAASSGVATFSSLRIDRAGNGYTLTAASGTLTGATSSVFNVTAATLPATRVAFVVQPSSIEVGKPMTPGVQVAARDEAGATVTSFTGTITLAIGTNPGGGTLSGTTSATAVNGVATYSGLQIDRAGNGYTLTAVATGLTGATSAPFNVTAPPPPPATRVAFVVQPSNTEAGQAITPAVQVAARDDAGSTVTSFTGTITLAIGSNPGGGTLSGTTSTTAVNGVATFSGLQIDRAGNGYTLTAAAAGLSGATSAAFNVTAPPPPPATRVAFVVQPSSTEVGQAMTPAVQVAARDNAGATVTSFTGTITLAIGTNPGGGTLSGTTSATAVNGVATFIGLRIDRAGNGYTLTAASGTLTSATSAAFDVTAPPPPAATRVAFVVQPSSIEVGQAMTPAVQVAARDDAGGTVTSFTGTITLAIGSNPGGGTLSGTTSANAVNGVATFSGLQIDRAGNGYTLTAASAGLTSATSATFNVTAPPPLPATRVVFTVQPSNTETGDPISPAVQVAARNDAGATVTSFTGTITLAIGSNPGGGTLSGTTSANAVNGVATFSGLQIDRAGNGYTLSAASAGLTGATSATFNVTAPPPVATSLRFIVQPSNVGVNQAISPPVQVMVVDAQGNQVPGYTGAVTIDLAPNLLNATVYGTLTVNAVNGVATFSNLRVNLVGIDFRLRAAFAGQAPIVTSNAFIVLL